MNKDFVYKLVNHRCGQNRKIGVLFGQRQKLVYPGRIRVKGIPLCLNISNGRYLWLQGIPDG